MSVANQGVLANITLSVWSGRKLDKKVSEEVDAAKATRTRAGNYNKNLFAGVDELEEVRRIAGKIRNWHHAQTLPWTDSGERLLPMLNFMDYKRQLVVFEKEFNDAKDVFCTKYTSLIAAQAFQLGALFNRTEYPDPSQIANKFSLGYTFSPVPETGDWRVVADAEQRRELEAQYKKAFDERTVALTKDLWERLHTCLTHMHERLEDAPSGERKIFRDSLLGNAVELCDMLTKLNITNDPALERARKALEGTVCNLDIKDLRESDGARLEVRTKVNEILDMMP